MTEDNAINDKLLTIAFRLLERTQSGQAAWAETDRLDTYAWSGSQNSVTISRQASIIVEFVIELRNTWGTVVEDGRFSIYSGLEFGGRNVGEMLQQLFELARRSALQVDSVIDDILGELE